MKIKTPLEVEALLQRGVNIPGSQAILIAQHVYQPLLNKVVAIEEGLKIISKDPSIGDETRARLFNVLNPTLEEKPGVHY